MSPEMQALCRKLCDEVTSDRSTWTPHEAFMARHAAYFAGSK
jgi:hypothetical protein